MKGEKIKDVFGLDFIKKKLDIMSGDIKNTEGIAKKNLTISRETFEKISEVSIKVVEIFNILKSEVEEPDESGLFFTKFKIENITIEGKVEKITMNEFQRVVGTFEAKKKNGQPAQVQNPRVELDHPEMATAEITGTNEVTVSAIEGAIPEPTALLVTVTADADLGEGVREISVVGTIALTPGEAETLEVTFGEPEDK